MFFCSLQYLLPAIVHINHQPYLERGDGPIVSVNSICVITLGKSVLSKSYCLSLGMPHSSSSSLHSVWCSPQPESWLSRFNRSHMTMASLPVSKAPVSTVEHPKDRRYETSRGVGMVVDEHILDYSKQFEIQNLYIENPI